MAGLQYNSITKYRIHAVCTSPLRIGTGNGNSEEVLVHSETGLPFIQASSLTGALRNYCEKNLDGKMSMSSAELFGANSENHDIECRIRVLDATFEESTLKIELRPHVKIDSKRGSVSMENGKGHKFNLEYVGVGAKFSFDMYLYDEENVPDKTKKLITSLILAMKEGLISLGAKQSTGAGNIALEAAESRVFDMTTADGRKAWREEENCEMTPVPLDSLNESAVPSYAYKIQMVGRTMGPLCVGGIATDTFGEGEPDRINIKNALRQDIIPGSSVKGVLRGQMEKIAEYIGVKTLISRCFGLAGEGTQEGYRGNLKFSDIVIHDENPDILRHRIHVDKVAGSVMFRKLFAEKNVCGPLEGFEITVMNDEYAAASLALLLFAIRDLSVGIINFGSGYATGKGFLDIENITLSNQEGETYSFKFDEEGCLIAEDSVKNQVETLVAKIMQELQTQKAELSQGGEEDA